MVYSVHTKVVVHAFLLFSNFSLQYSLSIAWIALDNPPEALVEPQDPPQYILIGHFVLLCSTSCNLA